MVIWFHDGLFPSEEQPKLMIIELSYDLRPGEALKVAALLGVPAAPSPPRKRGHIT